MPTARASDLVIGVASTMSSALPAGGPSRMSVRMTSASSISTMRCAVVDPTKPLPTTVTFFLLMFLSVSSCAELDRESRFLAPLKMTNVIRCGSARGGEALHVFDDGARKGRRTHFCRAWHQPLKVVRHFFLLDGAGDPVFDQLSCFV